MKLQAQSQFDAFLNAFYKDSRLKDRIIVWTFLGLVLPAAFLVVAGVPARETCIGMTALILPLLVVVYRRSSSRPASPKGSHSFPGELGQGPKPLLGSILARYIVGASVRTLHGETKGMTVKPSDFATVLLQPAWNMEQLRADVRQASRRNAHIMWICVGMLAFLIGINLALMLKFSDQPDHIKEVAAVSALGLFGVLFITIKFWKIKVLADLLLDLTAYMDPEELRHVMEILLRRSR